MPSAPGSLRLSSPSPRSSGAVRRLAALAAASVLATLLAGCGSGTSSSTTPPTTAKSLAVTPASLTFTTAASTVSTVQTATLSNTGNATVSIGSISIIGSNLTSFTQINTCGASLGVGANCVVSITFAPATVGSFNAAVTVVSDAPLSPSIGLTGTATAAAPVLSLSGTSLTFPSMVAGSTSAAQSLTLTNRGTGPLNLTGVALGGTGVNLFAQTTTCGATLAPLATCKIDATFAPKVAGSYAATLTLTDNFGSGTQTIPVAATATPFVITIDTTAANDWKINNGAIQLDWNSLKANIFGIQLVGYPDTLVDINHVSGGQPFGFYMDNTGIGAGTATATYTNAGTYLDWSITTVSNTTTNPFTYSEHFVVYPNDPGFHTYFVINHSATDIAGGVGQIQYVFRDSLTQFTNTYTVDGSLGNPGVQNVPLPASSEMFSTDPGRTVSDATADLHGFTDLPAGFLRRFYTKYDYSSYEYLHKAHGLFGSTYGTWAVLPVHDTQPGGPMKQNLIFTGNLLMMEAFSGHLDNPLNYAFPVGTAGSHLYGPFYIHFNTFGQAYTQAANKLNTPADMYADALSSGASFVPAYDTEAQLLASGYVPTTARGSVSVQVNNVAGAAKTAWVVLSDPNKNFQVSAAGQNYWADISTNGAATITGVVPGKYRMSVYVLGQFGELRQENIVVTANQTTTVPAVTFVPENFSTAAPLFTIGTPDRSAHEFNHGHDAAGHDDREFYGAFNYWADYAATNGAVIYNGTAGPAGPASNDPNKWSYSHWAIFNPGLYAGVYNPADTTTAGYTYAIPSYVAALPAASGTNGVTTKTPPWQIHFATPPSPTGSLPPTFVDLSVSVACVEGSYIVTLNGKQLIWHYTNASDCAVRSGLSGFTQWFVMQWDATALNPVGADNVITISMSQSGGTSDDAIRLELTNVSANPTLRGWNDYEFLYGSTDIPANDALPNP